LDTAFLSLAYLGVQLIRCFPCLTKETEPASEKSLFFKKSEVGQSSKKENYVSESYTVISVTVTDLGKNKRHLLFHFWELWFLYICFHQYVIIQGTVDAGARKRAFHKRRCTFHFG
jgi:hypothetical protein